MLVSGTFVGLLAVEAASADCTTTGPSVGPVYSTETTCTGSGCGSTENNMGIWQSTNGGGDKGVGVGTYDHSDCNGQSCGVEVQVGTITYGQPTC